MYTKQLLIGVLAFFLTLGLFGTAFAANYGTDEAGDWQYSFTAPATGTDKAELSHEMVRSTVIGQDEKGNSDFVFGAPLTKSEIAAINHVYNRAELYVGGGDYPGQFDNRVSLKCNGC